MFFMLVMIFLLPPIIHRFNTLLRFSLKGFYPPTYVYCLKLKQNNDICSYDQMMQQRDRDQERVNQFATLIADAKAEVEMLRQRFRSLNDEQGRLGTDNARIWDELQKARSDLDEETLGRIDFQNQVQTLMEELEFLRRVHDQVQALFEHLLYINTFL